MDTLDDDDVREYLDRAVKRYGKRAFYLFWDSGGPGGGAGQDAVYEFLDEYWPYSGDEGLGQPYRTLKEALKTQFTGITSATGEVSCEGMSPKALLAILDTGVEAGHVVTINGLNWEGGKKRKWKLLEGQDGE
jgi:hypothetical protein